MAFDRGNRGGGGWKPRGGGFRPGGRPSFGGASDDRRDDRPKEMHDAVCSSCGKDCQVPFRPSGGKPVFCRDCFSKEGGGRELGRQAGELGNGRDFAPSTSYSSPMRTSAPSGADSSAGLSEIKRQLEQINAKLERLIQAAQIIIQAKVVAKPIVPVEKNTTKTLSASIKDAVKPIAKKVTKRASKK